MDIFQKDKDLYITESGRARNRAPEDLMEVPLQHGTILNQEMINAWTFELYNLIKALGITPDRKREDQIAEGLEKALLYDRVGEIRSYLTTEMNHPLTEAVLDGRMLYASNYEDGLAMLKKRCPSWVSGENVRLPSFKDRFIKSKSYSPGTTQEDAMREITATIKGKITYKGADDIKVWGELGEQGWDYGDDKKYKPTTIEEPHTFLGDGVNAPANWEGYGKGYAYFIINPRKTVSISGRTSFSVSGSIEQDSRKIDKENRPKNFNVIMTVVAGIPKR